MSKLVLIDGNAILHRAYHALPSLTTRRGEPINAVYGLVSMLLKVIQDLKTTHVVIVTGDRDILQLVDNKVKVYMPVVGMSQGKLMGIDEVIEKMGVTPASI